MSVTRPIRINIGSTSVRGSKPVRPSLSGDRNRRERRVNFAPAGVGIHGTFMWFRPGVHARDLRWRRDQSRSAHIPGGPVMAITEPAVLREQGAPWPIFMAPLIGRELVAEGTMAFRFAKPPDWTFQAG